MHLFGIPITINLELTGLVLTAIAIWALIVAAGQLKAAAKQAEAAGHQFRAMVQQSRVQTLLELDERWEATQMQDIRSDLRALVKEVEDSCCTTWKHLPPEERPQKKMEAFAAEMQKLRETDPQRYSRLFGVCGYFETVGYVVKSGYIPEIDVFFYIGGAIEMSGLIFEKHIRKLLAEEGAQQLMYENFLWLNAKYAEFKQKNPGM